MASLNTLRTKGGWFLTGVILLALLAFILGDLGSCQGNRNPVVGEINGVKVKYMDYLQEREYQDGIMKAMGMNAQEDQAYDNAWTELIMQHSYKPGFAALGLDNSQQEQIDMTSGSYISPVIMQNFRNPQTGMFDMNVLRYFIENMDAGQLPIWQFMQKQMNNERTFSKYGALIANAMSVTDMEVRAGMNADNNVYGARIVFKPYSSIADSTVNITAAEIKDYYTKNTNKFKRSASREIEYVVFDILPSTDDMAAGHKRAEELAEQFAAAENPDTFVVLNSPDDKTAPVFVRESEVETPIAATLLGKPDAFYGPVLNGETFTMARLAETRMIPDSVTFSIIGLEATDTSLADSLMKVANRNNFAELARTHSRDQQTSANGGNFGAIDPLLFMGNDPQLAEALINTAKGQAVKIDRGSVIVLVMIDDKTAPVSKVKIATVKYTVQPSSTTHMNVMNQAREFYTKSQASYDDFQKTAMEMGLPKRMARIRNTDRNVNGIENSLSLVRWAFSNKKGAVAEPEEFGRDYIIVTALTSVTEEGTAPVEEVTPDIRTLLVQRKKADMLAEQMKGASLDAVAQSQNLQVTEAEGIRFQAFTVDQFGMEPRLVGAICSTAETGRLSAPVKGSSGVYLFEVTNIENTEEITEVDEKLKLESLGQYFLNDLIMRALYEKSNVRDNRVLYF